MTGMSRYQDKYFDLAIVDPPYGIGENWKKDRHSQFYKHESSYKNKYIPDDKYFDELFRVSKHQMIWGGNYYTKYLDQRNSWIVWDKVKNYDLCNMSEGELAWTSFNIPLRIFHGMWNGAVNMEKRYGEHPHEKPVALYKWLLHNYAKEGDKILDTHVGSGSSIIAAVDYGFDITGFELDKDYFEASMKRINGHLSQLTLV